MADDKGFDPLVLADSKEKLFIYREAELKPGRLPMLAAFGWPLSKTLDKPLAGKLGMKSLAPRRYPCHRERCCGE